MRPRCFDRPPLPVGEWVATGRERDSRVMPSAEAERLGFRMKYSATGVIARPVWRFRWSPFVDRCVSWDAPKIEDSVPARERWRCEGCCWLPAKAAYLATLIDSGERLAERNAQQLRTAKDC